jgi:hypothetical protein
MSMLAELAEGVIGVDTHKDTHTAAAVDARTGGVLARATVPADPDGYAALVELANQLSGLRAWAMEGAGGYGAGLTRHLAHRQELIIELDRPKRPTGASTSIQVLRSTGPSCPWSLLEIDQDHVPHTSCTSG